MARNYYGVKHINMDKETEPLRRTIRQGNMPPVEELSLTRTQRRILRKLLRRAA